MSSKGKSSGETGAGAALVPKLRFPEFQEAGAWVPVSLRRASVPVDERVGERKLTPVSISAGIGFVPQAKKFGRDISGNQYQLYTLVRDGDFVFNKGNSLKFPQGCIYLLQGWGQVAAPNVFIAFRLKDGYLNAFFQNCFEQNQHGKQLKRHITSGARSNGLLNISKETFFGIEVPTPTLPEQQRIADCLDSADALVNAQGRKVEALKAHKKGLMQQLFPRPERVENGVKIPAETRPRLRFPEFEGTRDWEEKPFSAIIDLVSGLHLSPDEYSDSGEVPYFSGPSDFTDELSEARKWTALTTSAAKSGDTLITVKGSGVGEVWFSRLPAVALGRQLMAVRPKAGQVHRFVFQFLLTKKRRLEVLGEGNLIPGLSRPDILDLKAFFPKPPEQQRIADCLTSLDDLIAAEGQKLDTLKTHKKGLMQQLPQGGEGNA